MRLRSLHLDLLLIQVAICKLALRGSRSGCQTGGSLRSLGLASPPIVFLLLLLLELSKNPQFVLRFGILTLLAVEPAEQVMRLGIVWIRLHGLAQRLQRLVIASLESKNLRQEAPAFPRTRIDFNSFLQIRQTLRKVILSVEKSP